MTGTHKISSHATKWATGTCLFILLLCAPPPTPERSIAPSVVVELGFSFERRVEAQQKIDEFYWRKLEWPEQNPQPKPDYGRTTNDPALQAKVDDYLRKSNALGTYWNRPVTPAQLQAETDRMVANTRAPKRLSELFGSLNNDGFLVAETIARPALVDRLIRNWYSSDLRFHGALREAALGGLASTIAEMPTVAPEYHEMTAYADATQTGEASDGAIALDEDDWITWTEQLHMLYGHSLPEDASLPLFEWTDLQEDRYSYYAIAVLEETSGRVVTARAEWPKKSFDEWWSDVKTSIQPDVNQTELAYVIPAIGGEPCTPDSWTATAITSAADPRLAHVAVWTGVEMIVWGGRSNGGDVSTGARYNPVTDTWRSTADTDLDPRTFHTAVWTGSEMIVWGGQVPNGTKVLGARYDPITDSWSDVSAVGAPTERRYHMAVWTGSIMIVWGGDLGGGVYTNTGGVYDSASDSWTATSTLSAPSARQDHSMVWTGSEVVVWGGFPFTQTGGRFDPVTNIWAATTLTDAPSQRRFHTTVWTGNEMIVWGGTGGSELNTGARYDPVQDVWTATSTDPATVPRARWDHLGVWTGSEMIVWSGRIPSNTVTGGRYDPATDTWLPTSTGANVPSPRGRWATAVWSGNEMIIWGGSNTDTGARYDPVSDSWVPTSLGEEMPIGRSRHTAAWTGNEMIIWGGSLGTQSNTGGRYDPVLDLWRSVSTPTNLPLFQGGHTAIWTGSEMIVWGTESVGGRYDPLTDTWIRLPAWPLSTSQRFDFATVWTGTEMIVWGGQTSSVIWNNGARYDPIADAWTFTSTAAGGAPEGRYEHVAVWTGTEMIVWGGRDANGALQSGSAYDPSTDRSGAAGSCLRQQ